MDFTIKLTGVKIHINPLQVIAIIDDPEGTIIVAQGGLVYLVSGSYDNACKRFQTVMEIV